MFKSNKEIKEQMLIESFNKLSLTQQTIIEDLLVQFQYQNDLLQGVQDLKQEIQQNKDKHSKYLQQWKNLLWQIKSLVKDKKYNIKFKHLDQKQLIEFIHKLRDNEYVVKNKVNDLYKDIAQCKQQWVIEE